MQNFEIRIRRKIVRGFWPAPSALSGIRRAGTVFAAGSYFMWQLRISGSLFHPGLPRHRVIRAFSSSVLCYMTLGVERTADYWPAG